QWGVELGKTLAARIRAEMDGGEATEHDPSTAALIAKLKGSRRGRGRERSKVQAHFAWRGTLR
ncbi:MAG: hypothetical protein ACREEQ_08055, partial [Caulobacteraceae bacterium]